MFILMIWRGAFSHLNQCHDGPDPIIHSRDVVIDTKVMETYIQLKQNQVNLINRVAVK